MKSKNSIAIISGIILFALLIAAAILYQSAYLLYAATAIPILLVPFLPDMPTSQILKPGRSDSPIRLYRTSSDTGEGFLIIDADPGAIRWNKRKLYFPVNGVPVQSSDTPYSAAALAVLQYDLIRHRRKKHLYGIELAYLNDRIRTMSYTTDEVTRLVIRMEDLTLLDPSQSAAHSAQAGKGLGA